MEISTDMKEVKNSRCFGIAYDGDVKECKICEVANLCKQKTTGTSKKAPLTPAPAKKSDISNDDSKVSTMKPSNPRPEPNDSEPAENNTQDKKPAKKQSKKAEVSYADDMPDFKPMSVEDLIELAEKRGIDPADFDKYTNVSIKKMRVTMALKKTYEVK